MSTTAPTTAAERHCDDSVTTTPTIERHIAECLAEAATADEAAMASLTAGDPAAAEHCWRIASLLRISAHLIQRNEAVAA